MSHDAARPLWGSLVQAPLTDVVVELSSSTTIDAPLAGHDVAASQAHIDELKALGLLDDHAARQLAGALDTIGEQIATGAFSWDEAAEDVHMNVEAAVRQAVPHELAGQLQAGRSRNEEIVTDERLWLLAATRRLDEGMRTLQRTLLRRAGDEIDTVLPAHTHTQPAQPMLLAHHLLAFVEMLDRDRGRMADAARRADRSPAGSGAAVGSGLPIDRERVAARLGFSGITANSLDAIGDRDYVLELVAACAITFSHLGRLASDLVLWSTPYLGFARLPDGFATGSSMLPNKRNPDVAELIRARAARANGALTALLGIVHGLPLGYHRDFQEMRGPMLEAVTSLELCLRATDGMVAGTTFDRGSMRSAAGRGHALATALAERLVRAGVPFRDAHWRVGELVAAAATRSLDLSDLAEAELRAALPELADAPGPPMPTLDQALAAADVPGGTAPGRVREALIAAKERIG
ncbi:MAG TPA: argininosuccinate lyase [Candidatus Limnocylindria bacterium]|nr:argininosuccinate lyase [Candidatus Limnocylindria bacterium]